MEVSTKQAKAAMSRERILDGARELILARGFSAMTVDAVCNLAGITKGGFFHHFASKDELGLAALDKFWSDANAREAEAGFNQLENPVQALLGYLDYAIEAYQQPELQKGCMLAIFTIELAESSEALFQAASSHFNTWRTHLVKMFDRAAKHAGKEMDALAWTDMFISTLEGVLVLAKSSHDPKAVKRALSLYKQLYLQAIA